MKRLTALCYGLIGMAGVVFGSAALAQDCTTPGPNDLYTDQDDSSASDSNNGRYKKDGGTGPFKTIQRLVDALQPGQCGFVRGSSSPYYENTFRNGDYSGVTFSRGGSSESKRIVLAGYPGERPVIDQRRAAAKSGYSVAGIFVYSGSYITIRNFEIRNTTASGIMTNPSGTTEHIVIENNVVHSIAGTGNPNNVGGIRVDHSNYCVVRGNVIHDIGDDDRADGINAFQPGNCILENNLIYNVALGVQLKQADAQHLDAHIVRNNIFANINDAVYKLQLQGAGMPAPRNSSFYNNVVYNARTGVWADLAEANEQATSLKIYNNTFIKSGNIASISNFAGVEVYNNIFADGSGTAPFVFNTVKPGPWKNSIDYFDNNLYSNVTPRWEIETYNSPSTFTSLESWRTNSREVRNPDSKSKIASANFVAAVSSSQLVAGDVSSLALASGSPALTMGRDGGPIGAVRPGVTIGPKNLTSVKTKIPSPPGALTVQ